MNEKQFQNWLKKYLRRISRFWPEKTTVYHRVKQDRSKYKCEGCGEIFRQKELQIDHIEPVIAVTGFVDWNTYIERLFCNASKLQALCKSCHGDKSRIENEIRRKNRKQKK